jgi:hypothetical protein
LKWDDFIEDLPNSGFIPDFGETRQFYVCEIVFFIRMAALD